MRLFHWLVTAPVALVLIVFAVTNRDAITLNFWPLPVTLQAPVYLIVFLALLAGFLIGELVAWINGRRWRREARHSARRRRGARARTRRESAGGGRGEGIAPALTGALHPDASAAPVAPAAPIDAVRRKG